MSVEENKAVLARGIEALNRGDQASWFALHDPSVVAHGLGPEPVDLEGMKRFYTTLWGGFPDGQVLVEDAFGEGDKVAVRFTFRGTHQGDFMGVPATGRSVAISGQTLHQLRGGKIVERWTNADVMGLMQQLGAVPEAAPA